MSINEIAGSRALAIRMHEQLREAEQFLQALKLRNIDTAPVRVPNAARDFSARPSLLIAKVTRAWLKARDAKPQ